MIFAARKLQGIGLIALLTACALAVFYLVSLRVAATQSELRQVEEQIEEVSLRNRMIEGDIAVVANIRQLDAWNQEMIGYAAPVPGQYLSGERAIASVERLRPIPGVAAPERVLMARADNPRAESGTASSSAASGSVDRSDVDRLAMVAEVASADVSAIPAGALR